MITEKISTNDIQRIGTNGTLEVTLPNYGACIAAKNLVSYTKKRYPREDGMTYTCSVDSDTCTIVIKVVEPENVNRKR